MIAVAVGLFGLVIGSFLNVVFHRVPIRQSIVRPSSRCPSCEERIKSFDNLPVLSYLMLRGRCRSCKARISPRYPLVEALTGVLFALAAYEFGLSLSLAWALILISVLITLAGTDLEHRLLPNAIVVPAAVVGFLLSALVDPEGWWTYLVSAVAVAAGLFALALAYPGGMGMGDVKMGGMLGAFLGPYAALAVFVGALLGALVGGALMVMGAIERGSALPFGVFLALAGVFTLFLGQDVWGWYLRLVRGA
ncbi:MAG: Leader peptidase (Prepilin peptidase) / N-methyltransferase [uncultured Rubrobacteraceae bacterium]|uniref:Leader peptidase (Prepilin peptidase) / N-methyltransferase n=1 Tax=uncultured Rubrobacteraceae bacterium TaxID=349277 RepID=A0A6J4QIH3_9ACTN|nr:MAG: Leader peptidase (Prepilin peptidase) / N-methyltransferase [uncultured Rubrobacteraceae bacterium]